MKVDSEGRLLRCLAIAAVVLCSGQLAPCAEIRRVQTPSLKTPRLPALKREIPTTHYLVVHLPLRGNAHDVSGNGNHGTINGARLIADRFGRADSAYSFDGVNDYLRLANERRFDLNTFTIAMHVKISTLPMSPSPMGTGEHTLISKGENAGNFTIKLTRWQGASYGSVSYEQRTPRGTWISGSAGTIGLNRFHHIAATVEGSVLRLYLDGQLKLEKTDVEPRLLNDAPVLIGRSAGALSPNWFKGIIDDVRVYSRALSAQEINQLRLAPEE
jgi:hypothetical protein